MTVAPLPTRDYLTRQELADHLNVSVSTVDRWVKEGMPAERWTTRLIRFRVGQAEAWLAKRARAA